MGNIKSKWMAVCIFTIILYGHGLAGPAKERLPKAMTKTELSKPAQPQQQDQDQPAAKPYYFYDKATDAYLGKIIDRSQKLLTSDDPNEAIALLVKEQARLDKKGRKVNLPGKYVKTPKGSFIKLRDGQKSDLPLASEDEVPRFPSPLILTLMTFRMENGQSPVEMIDYYQQFAKNYRGDRNSIFAASQTVSLMGFTNEKSWEFVNTTFDRTEKDQLIECFIRLALSDSKVTISLADLSLALQRTAPAEVPQNVQRLFASLEKSQQDTIEVLFWKSCAQWADYNIQNRLAKAKQCRQEKKYADAYGLYDTVLERYRDQEAIYSKVRGIRLESQVEEIFLGSNEYGQFEEIFKGYQELLDGKTDSSRRANVLRALCLCFLEDQQQASAFIRKSGFASEDFLACAMMRLFTGKQRKVFDEFAWNFCKDWKEYNFKTQYRYALTAFQSGQCSASLKYFDRIYERYPDEITPEITMTTCKTTIRTGDIDRAIGLLKTHEDKQAAEKQLLPDIMWLIQHGKTKQCHEFFTDYKPLLKEEQTLSVPMMFYCGYSDLLEGDFDESQSTFNQMKKISAKNLYTLKMSYLLQQKERLTTAYQITRTDPLSVMVTKAGRCFDEGEFEKALGIYLRIFAEYPDHPEESSKACYLLGYYYLLSGDFQAANTILVFLKTEYKTSTYANEADVLIQRIRNFTAS